MSTNSVDDTNKAVGVIEYYPERNKINRCIMFVCRMKNDLTYLREGFEADLAQCICIVSLIRVDRCIMIFNGVRPSHIN